MERAGGWEQQMMGVWRGGALMLGGWLDGWCTAFERLLSLGPGKAQPGAAWVEGPGTNFVFYQSERNL